jgi:hypothetical protein
VLILKILGVALLGGNLLRLVQPMTWQAHGITVLTIVCCVALMWQHARRKAKRP